MSVITTFTLDKEDLRILEKVAKEHGGMSRSAAMRYIIRDWARMRGYGEEEMGGRGGQAGKEPHKEG